MYALRLLGGYSLTGPSGKPVARLAQRRVEAVLAVLAVSADRGVTRDRLLGLLWGELDEPHARHNLNVALHTIRRVLGAEAVVSVGESLLLNPDIVTADTTLYAGAGAPLSAEAVAAYRGPLLDGFHVDGAAAFEDWVEDERSRLSREYAEGLERLAAEAEGAGNATEAAAWWARAVEHDRHNTRVVIRLMQALAAAGDRANALREAEAHRQRLMQELELLPEPELDAECERIRNGGGRPAPSSSISEPSPVVLPPPSSSADPPAVPVPVVAPRRGRRFAVAAGVAIAVLALGWTGWHRLHPTDPPLAFANIRQITRDPGLELMPAMSPDGREVAYMSGRPDRMHIEVRDIAGGSTRSITGDWGGSQLEPRWTPDGTGVRFRNTGASGDNVHGADVRLRNAGATTDRAGGLWTMPRMGGQAVAAGPGASAAVTRRHTLEWRGDSAFVRAADGTRTLLLTDAAQRAHSFAWSADGSALAYVVGNAEYLSLHRLGNISPSAIWVVAVGKAPVQVTDAASLNVSPAWLPDGRLLFVSDRDGLRDLYVVRPGRPGGPLPDPIRLTTGLEAGTVSASADGGTVAYSRLLLRRNLYTLPIPRTGSVSVREAEPLTALNQIVEQSGLSRDGKWLAYDSNLRGNQDIYLMPAAGGAPSRLTHDPAPDYSPDLSADGSEIVFHSLRHGSRDIYLIHADGTGEERLTDDSAESYNPVISPDGLEVAYVDWPAIVRVVRRTSRGGHWSAPETVASGWSPRWSPDGTRLLSWLNGTLRVLTPGDGERVLPIHAVGFRVQGCQEWSPEGELIYFCGRAPGGAQGLYQIPAEGGVPVLRVRFDDGMTHFTVTVGNGKFYLSRAELESDVYVMDLVHGASAR